MRSDRPRQERRRAPRHTVQGVTGTLRLLSKAEVLNVSVTGMAARTSTHLRVGQTCDLRLEYGAKTVRLPGRVVRANLVSFGKKAGGETAPVYEVGFEFHEVLSGQTRQLLELLRETAVVSIASRIAGRFKVRDGTSADLEAAADLLVRKISTSGMLVETEVGPERDQEMELNLDLGTVRLGCRGRVAYLEPGTSRPDEGEAGSPKVLVGVEFLDLSGAERATLEAFISEQLG